MSLLTAEPWPSWAVNTLCGLAVMAACLSYSTRGSFALSDRRMKRARQVEGFKTFQAQYLVVYLTIMLADWLQGTNMYTLYEDTYGVDTGTLFLTGFLSSAILGTYLGLYVDLYGRKQACVFFCVIEVVINLIEHVNNFPLLIFGRILSGISSSLLFSAFESWMVSEHRRRNYPEKLLSSTFAVASAGNGVVAILGGLMAQVAADARGDLGPFQLAIALTILVLALIVAFWADDRVGGLPAPAEEGGVLLEEKFGSLAVGEAELAVPVPSSAVVADEHGVEEETQTRVGESVADPPSGEVEMTAGKSRTQGSEVESAAQEDAPRLLSEGAEKQRSRDAGIVAPTPSDANNAQKATAGSHRPPTSTKAALNIRGKKGEKPDGEDTDERSTTDTSDDEEVTNILAVTWGSPSPKRSVSRTAITMRRSRSSTSNRFLGGSRKSSSTDMMRASRNSLCSSASGGTAAEAVNNGEADVHLGGASSSSSPSAGSGTHGRGASSSSLPPLPPQIPPIALAPPEPIAPEQDGPRMRPAAINAQRRNEYADRDHRVRVVAAGAEAPRLAIALPDDFPHHQRQPPLTAAPVGGRRPPSQSGGAPSGAPGGPPPHHQTSSSARRAAGARQGGGGLSTSSSKTSSRGGGSARESSRVEIVSDPDADDNNSQMSYTTGAHDGTTTNRRGYGPGRGASSGGVNQAAGGTAARDTAGAAARNVGARSPAHTTAGSGVVVNRNSGTGHQQNHGGAPRGERFLGGAIAASTSSAVAAGGTSPTAGGTNRTTSDYYSGPSSRGNRNGSSADPESQMTDYPDDERATERQSAAGSHLLGRPLLETMQLIYRTPGILLLGLSQAFYEGGVFTFVFMWVPNMQLVLGSGKIPTGLIFSCFMLAMTLGGLLYGVSVKWREQWSPPRSGSLGGDNSGSTSEAGSGCEAFSPTSDEGDGAPPSFSTAPAAAMPPTPSSTPTSRSSSKNRKAARKSSSAHDDPHKVSNDKHSLALFLYLLAATAMAVPLFFYSFWPVFGSFLVLEVSLGLYNAVGPAVRAQLYPDSHQSRLMNLFRVVLNLLVVCGTKLTSYAGGDVEKMRLCFFAVVGMFLIAALLQGVLLLQIISISGTKVRVLLGKAPLAFEAGMEKKKQ